MPTPRDTANQVYLQLLEETRRRLRSQIDTTPVDAGDFYGPDTVDLLEIYVNQAIDHLYENGNGYDPNAHAVATAYMIAAEYARNRILGQDLFGLPVWKARLNQWLHAAALSVSY